MKKVLIFILYPMFLFGQTQIGSDLVGENIEDRSGYSISISSDGSILAIGSPENDDNGNRSGHVRVFKNESGVWTQIGSDIIGENAEDRFGTSVSLSSDGSIVAIGANVNNGGGIGSAVGHVRVFKNESGVWTQIGSDIDGEATGDQFGTSVSLSSDGNIIAIGAIANSNAGNNYGNVRVFKNESGVWTQIGSSINGTNSVGLFGLSLDLNSDGSIITIGAPWVHDNGSNSGQVKVFKNESGVWTQIGSDINGDSSRDQFGWSVSLSSDGNILAVSAQTNDSSNPKESYVKIFKNESGVWTQVGSDIKSESNLDRFGKSISLSSNGNIIAIGATEYNPNNTTTGYLKIFKNNSGVWSQLGSKINGDSSGDRFGFSVSLSSDGNEVAVSAIGNLGTSPGNGYVKIYDLSEVLSTETNSISNFNIYPNPATKQITLDLDNSILKEVSIYNNLGQIVKRSKSKTINTSQLTSGIYFVTIETEKGKSTKKVIIN